MDVVLVVVPSDLVVVVDDEAPASQNHTAWMSRAGRPLGGLMTHSSFFMKSSCDMPTPYS